MEETNKGLYQFNDENERYKRMNRFYIGAANCLWVMFIIFLLLKKLSGNILSIIAVSNIVLIIIFMLGNLFLYFTNKASRKFKLITAVEIGIEFFLLGGQTEAEFIFIAMLGILALQIPYYDKKVFRNTGIGYLLLYTLIMVVRGVKGNVLSDVDSICRMLCIYMVLFIIIKIGSIAKEFSDDALGAVEEQSRKQKQTFDGIVGVSRIVMRESDKSSGMVDELVQVTKAVAGSMQEIAAATSTTAQSIEEQSSMTQSIQTAILETGNHSKKMVEIATDSNKSIQENINVMEELKEQSVQIVTTNNEVTDAMVRLQGKTKEVAEIAGMILNISSQTNLLALNASIESARAGEAGRGFAVVADQIRQLAEQTRSSTEEISRIITELNQNANDVVKSVENSVEATANQNEKILYAVEAFNKLNDNMSQLISDIHQIDRQIYELSSSNNKIVENISNLSAATEQVTASTEQVRGMSGQNLEYAQRVKEAIRLIEDEAEEMKRYL